MEGDKMGGGGGGVKMGAGVQGEDRERSRESV